MAKTVRLHKQRRAHYKYGIIEQISQLPRKMKIQEVIDHLATEGISRDEFYADRRIPSGSSKSIPSDRLIKYAQIFGCTIDDLLLDKVFAKSIRTARIAKADNVLRIKTKLS